MIEVPNERCNVKTRNQAVHLVSCMVSRHAWSFADQHYDGIRRFRRRDVIFFLEVTIISGPNDLAAKYKMLATRNYLLKVSDCSFSLDLSIEFSMERANSYNDRSLSVEIDAMCSCNKILSV